jgi:cytochrome c oxidase subunit I
MKYSQRPYDLLLIASALVFIGGFFQYKETVDIQTHDTTFVFPTSYVFFAVAIVFVLLWGIYRFLSKLLLSKLLVWLHVLLTIHLVFIILIMCFISEFTRPVIENPSAWSGFSELNRKITLMAIALFFVQVVFMFHIIFGILKYSNRKRLT